MVISNGYLSVPFFEEIPNEWITSLKLDKEIVIKALKLLEEIFNKSWENEQQSAYLFNRHPLYPFRRDYFFFERVVKLGVCLNILLEIIVDKDKKSLFKKLRDAGEFFHLEALIRIAGTFKKEGYEIFLEPKTNSSRADLVIKFNDIKVFFEIKTIGWEKKEDRKKFYILNQIDRYIFENRHKLPATKFFLYIQVENLPKDEEVEIAIKEVIEEINKRITNSKQFPWLIEKLIEKKGIIVELSGEREYKLRDDIIEAFKNALVQLPDDKLGIVVVIGAIRRPHGYRIKEYFNEILKNLDNELKDKSNILGVMIFAPYKGLENERPIGFKKYLIKNEYLENTYKNIILEIWNVLDKV